MKNLNIVNQLFPIYNKATMSMYWKHPLSLCSPPLADEVGGVNRFSDNLGRGLIQFITGPSGSLQSVISSPLVSDGESSFTCWGLEASFITGSVALLTSSLASALAVIVLWRKTSSCFHANIPGETKSEANAVTSRWRQIFDQSTVNAKWSICFILTVSSPCAFLCFTSCFCFYSSCASLPAPAFDSAHLCLWIVDVPSRFSYVLPVSVVRSSVFGQY